jgi:very-short-patch-repair endonuclease
MKKKVGKERLNSPMELALAEAFEQCGNFRPRQPDSHEWEIGDWPDAFLTLLAQPPWHRYRCDFGIASHFPDDLDQMPFQVVVEVDGHDFHERTREQAAHDRRRDRLMTAAGTKVFRFTGSEVYRDAIGCAAEVLEYVSKIQQENLSGHWRRFVDREAAARAKNQNN